MTDDKDSKEEELKDEDIKEEDMASFSDLFRFAGGCDWSSMIIGALASFTVGAMQPTSAVRRADHGPQRLIVTCDLTVDSSSQILFGDIMDITGGPQAMQSAVDEVLYKMVRSRHKLRTDPPPLARDSCHSHLDDDVHAGSVLSVVSTLSVRGPATASSRPPGSGRARSGAKATSTPSCDRMSAGMM